MKNGLFVRSRHGGIERKDLHHDAINNNRAGEIMHTRTDIREKRLGIILGGSGLIGGGLVHYFKTRAGNAVEVLSPNSKKLSLRDPADIVAYCSHFKPDFIINSAIAAIDSDPQMAFEVNYLGSVYLARAAMALQVPYIHISSAATMPNGLDLREEETLPLSAAMPNYAKSKLMAEKTLAHMRQTRGLDYTVIRLGVVYGKHDHKIQGFHRLFFAVANRSMPVLLTRPGVMHSYTHAKKIPGFVHHLIDHRDEFSGQTINFVDKSPVELSQLIITIKSYLELNVPKNIYLPLPLARFGKGCIERLIRVLNRLGVEARMPGELMFLDNFYQSQTLDPGRLINSSYVEPNPGVTVFTKLPDVIEYYLTRWEHLNLIQGYNPDFFDPRHRADLFLSQPEKILAEVNHEAETPLAEVE